MSDNDDFFLGLMEGQRGQMKPRPPRWPLVVVLAVGACALVYGIGQAGNVLGWW